MSSAYPLLLSPLKIGKYTLKNRLQSTSSLPHFHQGTEKYPADSIFAHFIRRARNGASIVTISGINDIFGVPPLPASLDIAHFPHFDIYDAQCQNYIMQLFDAIHYYDSIACVGLFAAASTFPYINPDGTLETVSANPNPTEMVMESGRITDAISKETLEKIALSFAQQSLHLKKLGVDMVNLHMCYRGQIGGQFLSPLTNLRTDEFGGSIENRSRFPLMVLKAIREAVGKDFIIELQVSGEEREGGNAIEDTIKFLKLAEEYIDIVQIRSEPAESMSTSFCLERTPVLHMAEKIKSYGLNMLVSCICGFGDPEEAELALIEGKLDIIGMARAWIANPNYGEMVYAGRSDDIVPCLRCNKCHGRGPDDPFVSVCSVNPIFGIEHREKMLSLPPGKSKNIAVVGGGPGGMRTAIYLSDRGHKVTLFEMEAELGGLIKHADLIDFKWTMRDYKKYLINQVEKRDIKVCLNTKATPEMLKTGFDIVIAAVGSAPLNPPILGADGENVMFAVDAIMNNEQVGQKVVVIGGGEVGVETGMFLAKSGRKVTVLEMRDEIAREATLIHYRESFQKAWEAIPTLFFIVNAKATEITKDGVTYRDISGEVYTLEVDTVVISAGMTARRDEALAFYDCADRFFMVGDCRVPGTIQSVNRSAYAVSSVI